MHAFGSVMIYPGGGETLTSMVQEAQFSWVNRNLEEWLEVADEEGRIEIISTPTQIFLASFDRSISNAEAAAEITRAKLVSVGIGELLALGSAKPRFECPEAIVALAASWRDPDRGEHHVTYIGRHESRRFLGLGYLVGEHVPSWPPGTIFLAKKHPNLIGRKIE